MTIFVVASMMIFFLGHSFCHMASLSCSKLDIIIVDSNVILLDQAKQEKAQEQPFVLGREVTKVRLAKSTHDCIIVFTRQLCAGPGLGCS